MFNPNLNTQLIIDGQIFSFSPHPAAPALVWGQEGRHAIVYRLQNNSDAYALKVFRPAFRHPGLLESAQALMWAHELPGMRVCRQMVITRQTHPELVAQHPDLDYAMLMPWIDGQTWFDFLQKPKKVSLEESRILAESMAWVLYALELNHLAHCDLSSGNVIIDPRMDNIHLVDVEDLYSPYLNPPPMIPAGTMGYQHRDVVEKGQWGPLGDRFAGAVLIAEMLGWAHPKVRKAAWGESYFAPSELQQHSERYELLRDILRIYNPGFAEAFEQAWRSRTLDECPPLKTWYDLLDHLPRDPVESWAPINPADFKEGPSPRTVVTSSPSKASSPPSPVQASPARPQVERKGCRKFVVVSLVLSLLCCYAGVLAVQWSTWPSIQRMLTRMFE